jgi:parallel beta-helix repeat protein
VTDGSIYFVSISEDGNFSTIQDAIDYATSEDTIYVKKGIYYENIVIDKSIILIGENNTNTIIDGRGAGNVIKINSDNVTIKNLTIQHSGLIYPNSGINVSSNNNTIEENIISNCFYSMTLYDSSDNLIKNNIIKESNNCGIYMTNSSDNFIINNVIKDHNYNGIGVYESSDRNSLINNSIFNNGYCGINIKISSMNTVKSNNISDNYIGIHIPSTENIIDENNFSNNNIDIDKDVLTPGFELAIIILSLIIFICHIRIKKIK